MTSVGRTEFDTIRFIFICKNTKFQLKRLITDRLLQCNDVTELAARHYFESFIDQTSTVMPSVICLITSRALARMFNQSMEIDRSITISAPKVTRREAATTSIREAMKLMSHFRLHMFNIRHRIVMKYTPSSSSRSTYTRIITHTHTHTHT
jgi:hypothetical protein